MRVLLVYSNQSHDLIPAPPIGLSYVASATRDAGHEIRCLDLILASRPNELLRRTVREFQPSVVGFSVRNIDNVVMQRFEGHLGALAAQVTIVREETRPPREKGGTTIVVGGPAISILGPAALDNINADIAVRGEGELSFPALLAAMESGNRLESVPGISFRRDGSTVSTPIVKMPSFGPSGMQEWIDWSAYEPHGATWPIQTKRGCSLPCIYCSYPVIEGSVYRCRSPEEVADEIEEVSRTVGPRTFEIVDSTFNIPIAHAIETCEEIARRELGVELTTMGVNPLQVTPDLFPLMKRVGFNSMMVSPESASEAMLTNLGKGFGVDQVRLTAMLARESGLHSIWFFMLGGPGETRESVEQTVSFMETELNWNRFLNVVFTGVRILPGTTLARRVIECGDYPPETDFAKPIFHVSEEVGETWILDRLNAAIQRCPNIVHAAEEGTSFYERVVHRGLFMARVAPPYWRFLPQFLSLPPLRYLRRRFAVVGNGPTRGTAGALPV
jgi:hypothetical protein